MVDLNDFTGQPVVIARNVKARAKAQEKLDKLRSEKIEPLEKEIAMYDKIIAALQEGLMPTVEEKPREKTEEAIADQNKQAATSTLETSAPEEKKQEIPAFLGKKAAS